MKFSIIVCAYNEERYLKDCLTSLNKQSFKDFETILIDDGSTDSTSDILKEYVSKNGNSILIHHEEKKGVSYSRNEGIEKSEGEYILFLDGDDYFFGNALEKINGVIEANTCDLVHCFILSDKAGEDSGLYFNSLKQGLYEGKDKEKLLGMMFFNGKNSNLSLNSFIYKRELIKDMKIEDINLYDGVLFTMEATLKAKKLYFSNTYFYCQRIHLYSLSISHYINSTRPFISLCEKIYGIAEKYGTDEEFIQQLTIYLYERMLVGQLDPFSVLMNEYYRNPYPKEGRKNMRELLDLNAVQDMLKKALKRGYKKDYLEILNNCTKKNEEFFYGLALKREEQKGEFYQKKYGYAFPNEYCINIDKKIIYLVNPKVANSSIKATFADYDYEDDYEVQKLQRLQTDMIVTNEIFENMKNFFKFTFVREPYHRLVSAYESKFKSDLRMGFNQLLLYHGGIFAEDKGFDYFLEKVISIDDDFADRHFRSQYSLIYDKDGNKIMDFVGHFENLTEEFKPIQEKYGLKELPRLNKTDKRDKKDWRSYFTLETAEQVYKRYKKDFEVFGYEDVHKELIEYLKNKETEK